MRKLKEEIPPDSIQYGGLKGSSVEHMLVEVWERILGGLEVPDVAVTLLGVDYEKAFNRMGHDECLSQLAQRGASQFSVDMISTFLYKRCMRSRIGGTISDSRPISAGSPQGSILGCFLYCITTQQLGTDLIDIGGQEELEDDITNNPSNAGENSSDSENELSSDSWSDYEDQLRASSTPLRTTHNHPEPSLASHSITSSQASHPLTPDPQLEDSCLGPNARFMNGGINRIADSSSDGESNNESLDDSFRTAREASVDIFDFLVDIFKYVDDTTIVESVDTSNATKHYTTGPSKAICKARYSEKVAEAITEKAEEIGMKVNGKKTQLLMISPPNGYVNSSFINIQGQRIKSINEMKLLGFVFGSEPNVSAHVESIKKKFKSRFWSLIHLKRSGISGDDLFKLFNVFIRPVIEFCSVIYHPLLTKKQSSTLERMQRQATRLAYGWDISYQDICAIKGITTLEERRTNYIDCFVRKTLQNPRFSNSWFPLRDRDQHNIRDRKIYQETRSRTQRYYNSPLSFLRRRANYLNEVESANLVAD